MHSLTSSILIYNGRVENTNKNTNTNKDTNTNTKSSHKVHSLPSSILTWYNGRVKKNIPPL